MGNCCLGYLSEQDPLYSFLAHDVIQDGRSSPRFIVYAMDNTGIVYRYWLVDSDINLVGKFYGRKWLNGSQNGNYQLRVRLMHREFGNLERVRELGLNSPPYRAVRPLAINEHLNCVLLEDYAPGATLQSFLWDAMQGDERFLHKRLCETAGLLATLHNRSQTREPVDATHAVERLGRIIEHLEQWRIVSPEQLDRLRYLLARWNDSAMLKAACKVLIHGDPNPEHFLFQDGEGVTAIDWERLWSGDRAADLGCLAAEIKHAFLWHSGNPNAGESYIQHLYGVYFSQVSDQEESFPSFCQRARFYMGCGELRICRNPWVDLAHRQRLIEEAEACLQL